MSIALQPKKWRRSSRQNARTYETSSGYTGPGRPIIIKLGNSYYVTRGEILSTNPPGYFHVDKKLNSDGTTTLEYKSQLSTCKSCFKRSKMASQRTLCIHLDYAILATKKIKEKSLELRPSTSTSNELLLPTTLAAKTTNVNKDLQTMCLFCTMNIQLTSTLCPFAVSSF